MNQPDVQEEPLNNVELESAILGLRMALTPEEEVEAREHFLTVLRDSTLSVPTVTPTPTAPDGSILPNADITFVVAQTQEGVSGVPGFTTLGQLRGTLPDVQNGMFLTGAQLGGILGNSPHKLFVDGPEMHVEVSQEELVFMAQSAQKVIEDQQAAANHNVLLEQAIAEFKNDDSTASREALINAFGNGFCRLPVATEADKDTPVVVLRLGDPNQPETVQEVPLLTDQELLLAFTGEEALGAWSDAERNVIALPGGMIAQLIAQTGVGGVVINKGAENSATIKVEQNQLVVA
ncbi:hypothetical protein CCAX7_39580 [Capsulimonas corticalis]|uniref:SseB protein N-terminal domain-containing protein n=1 Tax=Capsulimonas corticalis TaxID=2219043 RepID=A0A402D3D1_9BACT|nr:SseB family protein [Capsulimonas corticalis]BDI31907.1 hypothetical protein CCAX7_39580 [Capsulimonas corticalis]